MDCSFLTTTKNLLSQPYSSIYLFNLCLSNLIGTSSISLEHGLDLTIFELGETILDRCHKLEYLGVQDFFDRTISKSAISILLSHYDIFFRR